MEKDLNLENKAVWEANADFWDQKMGEKGNRWHLELIAPASIELLELNPGDKLLDIGCGNGLFARNMQRRGIKPTAFDFSAKNILNAKSYGEEGIEYLVLDATDYNALLSLGVGSFDGAVANMVLQDMPKAEILFKGLAKILKPNGVFVFSIPHPCFHVEGNTEIAEDHIVVKDYHQAKIEMGVAIDGQPELQYYWHRTIAQFFNMGFTEGFVVDGMREPVFQSTKLTVFNKIPPVMITRMRLLSSP